MNDQPIEPAFDEEFERRIREAAVDRTHPMAALIAKAQQARPATEQILEQRHTVHGDFHQDSRIAQALKHIMREGVNWNDLTPVQKEALDHIATKIARILAGDPNHRDHWEDLIGYPTLVLRSL